MYIEILIVLFLACLIAVPLCNNHLSKWACTRMHWHKAPNEQTIVGINTKGICPRCDKDIMKDSQGNWF